MDEKLLCRSCRTGSHHGHEEGLDWACVYDSPDTIDDCQCDKRPPIDFEATPCPLCAAEATAAETELHSR